MKAAIELGFPAREDIKVSEIGYAASDPLHEPRHDVFDEIAENIKLSTRTLISFTSKPLDSTIYLLPVSQYLGPAAPVPSATGYWLDGCSSFEDLIAKKGMTPAVFGKLLAPLPDPNLPVYLISMNDHGHAAESGVKSGEFLNGSG
ncbi:uncharacterized protein PAC_00309 [Phialocephala subalpina]|uniref:Uncharacterized protein n=1 Tax=Phialocephala subalpina TaxID=576137 RepID=A0A1L7WCC3_9HELO|nr:uncharacterized protein PAC_00309 [Phialocephala subalpina]